MMRGEWRGFVVRLQRISIVGWMAVAASCAGPDDVCKGKSGFVTCGYCAEDVLVSSNPNAGRCIYCPEGTSCSTHDACDVQLRCVTEGGGGGGGCVPTGCPPSSPWYGCGSCWASGSACHTRNTSNLSDDCSICRRCP
jgi:hypothetical protein